MAQFNHLVCLDLEGVLVPELWIEIAEHFNIPELYKTTRDIPDYTELMVLRINAIRQKGLKLVDLQVILEKSEPLNGAQEFIAKIRQHTQLVIVSDTFIEFFRPLAPKLNWPTIFCNRLQLDEQGYIHRHLMRHPHGKGFVISHFQQQGFTVSAAGDSYNDVSMLEQADNGCFFRAPASISKQFPHLKSYQEYEQLFAEWKQMFDWGFADYDEAATYPQRT